MKSIYSIVMLALLAFVMTTHAVGVIRLQNDTLVPNNLGVGAPDSSGVTMLPNGTYGAYVNGAVGSKIGPVLVRDWHNGTVTASANIVVGARDNETDSNSTGNLTDPSSTNSTQNFNASLPSDWGAQRVRNR